MSSVGIPKATTPELSRDEEGGAVAVMVAIIASLLIVCLAFAIDLGYAWQVKRAMVKSTDAAALAAAQAATGIANLSVRGPCPTSVDNEAVTFLNANTTGASLEFCRMTGTKTGASNASQSSGIVTVRAMQTANFSFSRLFGLNSTDIYSSTSARWNNAPLLPFVACANRGNSSSTNDTNVADWYANQSPSRAPLTITSNWEGTDTSTLCSNGSSGGYGMIDLASSPMGLSDFDMCNSSNAAHQKALATNLASWIGGGYPGTITPGPLTGLRCAKVGQPFGSDVDKAICQARGKEVAVPLVGTNPNQNNPGGGAGKDWIVEISGFALVTIDDYTDRSNQNLCDSLAASASLRNARHLRLASARKSEPCGTRCSGDLGVAELPTWPTSVVLNTPTTVTVQTTNNSVYALTDAVLNVTISSTSRPNVTIPTGCQETSRPNAIQVVFDCPYSMAEGAIISQSMTWSGVMTTPVTVTVKISSKRLDDANPSNNSLTRNISVTSQPTTTSSSTTTTTTTTTTVPPTTTSTTVVPSGGFTRLVMTFLRTATDGSACCNALNRLYSYRICAVNISTAAAALSPAGCSDNNSGVALSSQLRAKKPFDMAAHRRAQNHNKRRVDIRVTKSNIRDRRAERILP